MFRDALASHSLTVWTLLPLAACSIVALAVILDRLIAAGSTRRVPAAARRQFDNAIARGDIDAATDILARARPFFAPAIDSVIAMRAAPKALRDEAASQALRDAARGLDRRRSALVTIAALAPMLGLLGTVTGMMEAFRALEAHQGPVDPSIVAGGLWQAMITTAAGLAIALPCLLASAWLKSWSAERVRQAGSLLTRLSIAMETERSA